MTHATLLHKEDSPNVPLTTIVETSRLQTPPYEEYDITLTQEHLTLKKQPQKQIIIDEGFESDIDSLSIISNDSFSGEKGKTGGNETDSANGSTGNGSDSENECAHAHNVNNDVSSADFSQKSNETYSLVNVLGYTDVNSPHLLVLIIETTTYVFKFQEISVLNDFYTKFTNFKAVVNQKLGHTQDTLRRGQKTTYFEQDSSDGPSSIISINTPEDNLDLLLKKIASDEKQSKNDANLTRNDATLTRSDATLTRSDATLTRNDVTLTRNDVTLTRTLINKPTLRKVWSSADNLLSDIPKVPERRKKKKPAPLPPKQDILSGEYVRIAVSNANPPEKPLIAKSTLREINQSPKLNLFPKSLHFLQKNIYKCDTPVKFDTLSRRTVKKTTDSWSNSTPRPVKHRSRSESRNVTPMAYRYVDTTMSYPVFVQNSTPPFLQMAATQQLTKAHGQLTPNLNNRFFGLSAKLKDFTPSENAKFDCSKGNSDTLKSVIKKSEVKKSKNDKKVTFSAYTTVQVV